MIPGIRNFFGAKLGQFVGTHAESLNPLGMNAIRNAFKLTSTESPGWRRGMQAVSMAWKTGQQQRASVGASPFMLSDYFSGRNMSDAWNHVSPDLIRQRSIARLAAPAALVGSTALNMLIGDNPISTAGRMAVSGAATVGVAGAMGRFGGTPGAYGSMALMSLAGINLLRRGDNFGPF